MELYYLTEDGVELFNGTYEECVIGKFLLEHGHKFLLGQAKYHGELKIVRIVIECTCEEGKDNE